MSTVQHSQRHQYNGKPGIVLAMGEVFVRAVKFTDSSGRENVGFAFIFGKDPTTGKRKVAFMNPDKVSENCVQPTPTIEDGILKLFDAENRNAEPPSLPDGAVGGFDLEDVP